MMVRHKRWCATQVPIPFGAIAERGPCNCKFKLNAKPAQPRREGGK